MPNLHIITECRKKPSNHEFEGFQWALSEASVLVAPQSVGMNESYPSHRVPQQNPMKHRLLHRVALMRPMGQGRVKGVSKGSLEEVKRRISNLNQFPTLIA